LVRERGIRNGTLFLCWFLFWNNAGCAGEIMNGSRPVKIFRRVFSRKKYFQKNLAGIKKVLSLYHKTKLTTMVTTTLNPIKTKKLVWGKKGKEVTGWLKLRDGSKTHFSIDRDGEWEQWGNSRDNLCLTVPFVENLRNFLMFSE